jgi:hypothetical protein
MGGPLLSPTPGSPARARHRSLFSADLRDRIADRTITVSYRLWSSPKVKVGVVYRRRTVMIEIDEVELLPFSSVPTTISLGRGSPALWR